VHICSDEELVQALKNGDISAFDVLFKKYSKPLLFFINQIIHNKSRAEDIFQDTFVKVLEHKEKYDDRYRFSTWIYRIALNLSINELQKKKREHILLCHSHNSGSAAAEKKQSEPYRDFFTPLDYVLQNEQISHIEAALHTLTASQRAAFVLKFYHHLSYEEIAAVMECSIGTVKSRIHYAVENIKNSIGV